MLAKEIQQFLYFFKLSHSEIDSRFGVQYHMINWNWTYDGVIMEKSGLVNKIFSSEQDFFNTIYTLKHSNIDYYPTFLRILDMLRLPLLDKRFEMIFLGKPDYECSN